MNKTLLDVMKEIAPFVPPPANVSLPQPVADFDESDEPTQSGEAKETITEFHDGYSIRHVEGDRMFLNWQAGVLIAERRHYQGPGMTEPFRGTVSLFHLRGFGATREEAIEMAVRGGRSAR